MGDILAEVITEAVGERGSDFKPSHQAWAEYYRLKQIEAENTRLRKRAEQYGKYLASARCDIVDADDVCPKCGGSGYVVYGSTATWRGGVGGMTLTSDVCDRCWGSGSKSRPWPSWRQK